jgi:hypothetical protein
MAKAQFHPVPQTVSAVQDFHPHAVKTWLAVFPATAVGILLSQPAFGASAGIAAVMTVMAIGVAIASVTGADMRRFNIGQMVMGIIAPVQFALMIWVSVYAGHMIAGDTLVVSTLSAFVAFALLFVVDLAVSLAVLLMAARGSASGGASAASYLAGKYSGLLGRIF